jgi:hypothetical protein
MTKKMTSKMIKQRLLRQMLRRLWNKNSLWHQMNIRLIQVVFNESI